MGHMLSFYADELALAVLAGVPLAVTTTWLLHRFILHRASGPALHRMAVLDGLLIASILPFLYATLSRGYGIDRTLSLIPFAELSTSFGNVQVAFSEVTLLNVGGNMALLFFFGALLPLRSERFGSLGRVLAVTALMSAGVEVLQFVLSVGRVSSVDDVLVNAAGGLLGALSTRPWWLSRRSSGETASAVSAAS